jgi:hypothetical protein
MLQKHPQEAILAQKQSDLMGSLNQLVKGWFQTA